MKIKGRFPYITWERMAVALLAVWAVSFVLWFFTPQTMPPWVSRYRIPDWLAHNWPWSIIPAFLLGTLLAHKYGLMKSPLPPEPTVWPLRPNLKNEQFWAEVEKGNIKPVPPNQPAG
jgi:hypothetical protein